MSKDFLLEIGVEEMPARWISDAMRQLKDIVSAWLEKNRIDAQKELEVYATPRRLAVIVRNVAETQSDLHQKIKGPSIKVAKDAQGNWSKAAIGFCGRYGVNVETCLEEDGYLFVPIHQKGTDTYSLLSAGCKEMVESLHFPKNMRWEDSQFSFVRPIRFITALFGEQVISFECCQVKSNRISYGHRFLGSMIEITSPSTYVLQLKSQYVIADVDERRNMILSQMQELEKNTSFCIEKDESLLNEVVHLVEYPTVLQGSFSEDFLRVPSQVLMTSMKEHQRYFPVKDQYNKLLPHFVTVRNGDHQSQEIVVKGNEKVLRARLQDAVFFYDEDLKTDMEIASKKLDQIVYREELGSVGDKVRRIVQISKYLNEKLGGTPEEKAQVIRTAYLCKNDLVSHMVYEFPELQGIMGKEYALKSGEDAAVALAIEEHYQPRSAEDSAPNSFLGSIVGLADKIDTLVGAFSLGLVPTGSQDPYGLRRQANGVVAIILTQKWPISLLALIEEVKKIYGQRLGHASMDALKEFFVARVKFVFSEHFSHEVIQAVLHQGIDDVMLAFEKASVLSQTLSRRTLEAFSRAKNLVSKVETSMELKEKYFVVKAEQQLFEFWQKTHQAFQEAMGQRHVGQALSILESLTEPIHHFFDEVMIMVEDEKIKQNRLALLQAIVKDVENFANFSELAQMSSATA